MPDLFAQSEAANLRQVQPLSARMRPRSLAEFVGQQHFLGEGKLLWRMLRAKRLGSVIFYGPPGTGKTTLARLLAEETDSEFRQLSAVTSGVKDLSEILEEARTEVAARSRVFEFQPLSNEEIKTLARRALADKDRGLGRFDAAIDDDALEYLAQVS